MPKFFQQEIAAYRGERRKFRNVDFKKNDFENSVGATAGTLLEFIPVHVKNPPIIQFMAYIESISDSFTNQFSSNQPFGRLDPFYVWKSANRSINVTWTLPSSSKSKALDNLNNLSWLISSLYPAYKETDSASSISASPMFRVRYANIIASPTQGGQGILCNIPSLTVTPAVKKGYTPIHPLNMGSDFANTEGRILKDAGFDVTVREGDRLLIPLEIKLTAKLNIIHDHSRGWDHSTGKYRGGPSAQGYPYLLGLKQEGAASGQPNQVKADSLTPSPTPAGGPESPGGKGKGSTRDKVKESRVTVIHDNNPGEGAEVVKNPSGQRRD